MAPPLATAAATTTATVPHVYRTNKYRHQHHQPTPQADAISSSDSNRSLTAATSVGFWPTSQQQQKHPSPSTAYGAIQQQQQSHHQQAQHQNQQATMATAAAAKAMSQRMPSRNGAFVVLADPVDEPTSANLENDHPNPNPSRQQQHRQKHSTATRLTTASSTTTAGGGGSSSSVGRSRAGTTETGGTGTTVGGRRFSTSRGDEDEANPMRVLQKRIFENYHAVAYTLIIASYFCAFSEYVYLRLVSLIFPGVINYRRHCEKHLNETVIRNEIHFSSTLVIFLVVGTFQLACFSLLTISGRFINVRRTLSSVISLEQRLRNEMAFTIRRLMYISIYPTLGVYLLCSVVMMLAIFYMVGLRDQIMSVGSLVILRMFDAVVLTYFGAFPLISALFHPELEGKKALSNFLSCFCWCSSRRSSSNNGGGNGGDILQRRERDAGSWKQRLNGASIKGEGNKGEQQLSLHQQQTVQAPELPSQAHPSTTTSPQQHRSPRKQQQQPKASPPPRIRGEGGGFDVASAINCTFPPAAGRRLGREPLSHLGPSGASSASCLVSLQRQQQHRHRHRRHSPPPSPPSLYFYKDYTDDDNPQRWSHDDTSCHNRRRKQSASDGQINVFFAGPLSGRSSWRPPRPVQKNCVQASRPGRSGTPLVSRTSRHSPSPRSPTSSDVVGIPLAVSPPPPPAQGLPSLPTTTPTAPSTTIEQVQQGKGGTSEISVGGTSGGGRAFGQFLQMPQIINGVSHRRLCNQQRSIRQDRYRKLSTDDDDESTGQPQAEEKSGGVMSIAGTTAGDNKSRQTNSPQDP